MIWPFRKHKPRLTFSASLDRLNGGGSITADLKYECLTISEALRAISTAAAAIIADAPPEYQRDCCFEFGRYVTEAIEQRKAKAR